MQEQCQQQQQPTWLNRQQTCPNPRILDFYPKSGPLEGGTNLTIEGINLGRNYEDIENGISIIHEQNGKLGMTIPCHPYQEEYVKTSRIKCRVATPRNFSSISPNHPKTIISGPVVVRVQADYSTKSRDLFSLVNPKILNIYPIKGPLSGGTVLSIEGLFLNAGSRAEAFLGDLPCNVTLRTVNHAECITSARGAPGEEQLSIRVDNGQRSFEYYRFLYVDDPKIDAVESGPSGIWKSISRGIPSGGIHITVRGDNLNIIQKPQMYVEYYGDVFASNCTTVGPKEMRCESPPVAADQLDFTYTEREYIEMDYGFIMDGVPSVRSLTTKSDARFPKFRMYRNPEFQLFSEAEKIKYYRSDYLTINVSLSQPTSLTVDLICSQSNPILL